MNNSKGISTLLILLLVSTFVLVVVFIYRNGVSTINLDKGVNNETSNTEVELEENTSTLDSTQDWKLYTNSAIGFQLKYPKEYHDAYANPGLQAWEYTPTWGTVNFYKDLNKNFATLLYFPFNGDIDDLATARDVIEQDEEHPVIPDVLIGSIELVKTTLVDGYTARWYKVKLDNHPNKDFVYEVSEVHFIGKGYGFIMKNDNTYFDEESFTAMLSSFKFTQ